ncbi:putative potassium channel beta subunit protein, partial [Serendipita vermifera]
MTEYFEFKVNEKMEYRRLGRSGLRVSNLSLGGWLTIGGTVKGDPVRDIIKCAWENGVNFIDTAEGYAEGQSEREIGRCLKELNIRRSDLVLSTKVFWGQGESPNSTGLSRKHIIEALDASLERLGTSYVDIYFAHRPDPTVPMEEVVRAFNWCIEQGKAHYWGTSEWSPREIEEAHHVCSRLNLIAPVAEQAEHSLFRRERAEGEYQHIYQRYGTKLTVFSALYCGFLTGKYNDGIPEGSRFAVHTEMDWLQQRVQALASPEGQRDIEKVRKLTEIAKSLGASVTQLSLAYILKMDSTATIIMGCKTPEQMKEQLGALDVVEKIDADIEQKVEEIFANKPQTKALL